VEWQTGPQALALAAPAMRWVLIDYGRGRGSAEAGWRTDSGILDCHRTLKCFSCGLRGSVGRGVKPQCAAKAT
jgi:hypothetical protein